MTPEITSVHNPRIKQVAALREHKHRLAQHQFLVDGERELSQALAGGFKIIELFVCHNLFPDENTIKSIQSRPGVPEPTWVSQRVFGKLAYGERSDGIVAVVESTTQSLSDFTVAEQASIGVLESVEKPGNIGAVIRSAVAAGIDGVVCADCPTDLYNPNVIRASLGSVFRLPIISAGSKQTSQWLRDHDFRIYVARVDAEIPYTNVDYSGRVAVVVGSESSGLSELWSGPEVTPIVIPMSSRSDSLNVSVAAAVLFFRLRSERTQLGVRQT